MRSTTFKLSTYYELIFLSFAFDSLLKVDIIGTKFHFGIIAILFSVCYGILSSWKIYDLKDFFLKNWPILPFFLYQALSLIINNTYPGTFKVALYFFLGVAVFYCIYLKVDYISATTVVRFQWILVLTGLFQFGLFKLFGYQLTFYDAEHYMVDASFALRLRGFFLEPNWYSIIMSFNTLLLISFTGNTLIKNNKILSALSVLCLVLNSSYTFIGIVVLILLFEGITNVKNISGKRIAAMVLLTGLMVVLLFGRANMSSQQSSESSAINSDSRLFPVVRTVDFMNDQNWMRMLFGFGVGSWPYYGIYNNLGYMGFFGEYEVKPAKRDSAEFQVFILELGYLSIILLLFDYAYHYFKFRKQNLLFSIACAYLAACYFIYPIYNFMIYLVPYYVFRSRVIKGLQ